MAQTLKTDVPSWSRDLFLWSGIAGVTAGAVTLAIVILPYVYGEPASAQERFELHGNPWYQLSLWLSFLNIFAILLAAWGLSVHRLRESFGAATSGMLFLLFYGAAELISRSVMIFTREYRWVGGLEGADDEARAALLDSIRVFDEVWAGVFPLILISHTLAVFLFGWATRGGDRLQQLLSLLLFAAAALGVVYFLAQHVPALWPIAAWGYVLIQPTSRLLIGIFLLRESSRIGRT